MANILLSPDELKDLQSLQNEANTILIQLGSVEMQLSDLKILKNQIIVRSDELKQKQQQLGTTLNQKYGVGSINLESGEFIKAS